LFTVYDGQTLRKGEYTFSMAYSNFDRDPGNVDITEVPVSFQVGLSDHWELFFNTDAYRAMKVNSPGALSGFALPNSKIGGVTPGAIILAPNGLPAVFTGQGIYRPAGKQPFTQYPYVGASAGNYSPYIGIIGNPIVGGNGADLFPGVGAPVGGILPGLVFGTVALSPSGTAPYFFTNAPSYLPDAPFLNREFGESSFNTFTVGAKWRWTGPNSPVGVGIIPFYRFYANNANSNSGFNQLQRGASPGGNRGDVGAYFFADSRLAKWANLSANVGYIYNSSVKAEFPTGTFTLLDRGDELQTAIGLDFPVNRYFQPIGEIRSTRYVGGRTPNAFENNPIDALVGFRIYPARWMTLGFAYRYHANEQDFESFDGDSSSSTVVVTGAPNTVGGPAVNITRTVNFQDLRGIYPFSTDPHGYIFQFAIGRRNDRGTPPDINVPADVTGLEVGDTEVNLGCPPGMIAGPSCNESQSVSVRTTAVDKENDTLIYNYTVSGGRIVGQGANVNWDLAGVKAGTYTITSGVDDGCGVCGKTQTKTITVKECADCKAPPIECPTVSVTGPGSVVRQGEEMVFTANVNGGSCNPTYNWSISAGTITSGQGTPVIRVGTEGLAGQSVTATVDVGGCDVTCPRNASETGSVAPIDGPILVDEFGDEPHDATRGRLDSYFIELQNDTSSTGVIINYGPAKQKAARVKLIQNHIKFRKFDASRITFVDGGDGELKTKLYRVPAGASQPTP
jgi:hypothetical protein